MDKKLSSKGSTEEVEQDDNEDDDGFLSSEPSEDIPTKKEIDNYNLEIR